MSTKVRKLNERLASWAGLDPLNAVHSDLRSIIFINKGSTEEVDFTTSLDSCFKWLAPKLLKDNWEIKVWSRHGYWFAQFEKKDESDEWSSIAGQKTPSKAFCLALILLIDNERSPNAPVQ